MGFNWLSFYNIFQAFQSKFADFNPNSFQWFKNFTYDWTHSWDYGTEITKVSYALSAIIGTLPLPIVYLMGMGFAVTLVLCVLRIVIDLL